jgi:hypothetical protein
MRCLLQNNSSLHEVSRSWHIRMRGFMKLSPVTATIRREPRHRITNMTSKASIDVKNLSDRKLWELLQLREVRNAQLEPPEVDRVRLELHARNQLAPQRRFHAPR